MLNRRRALQTLITLTTLAAFSRTALANPTRSVRMIAGLSAGSAAKLMGAMQ